MTTTTKTTDETKREKAFDTIKKLLALSGNNSNEHEAQAAMAKALELMKKYNIERFTIEASEEQKSDPLKAYTRTMNQYFGGTNLFREYGSLLSLIAREHQSQIVIHESNGRNGKRQFWEIFALPHNAEMILAMYNYCCVVIVKTMPKNWKNAKENGQVTVSYGTWQKHYIMGFTQGIRAQMNEIKKQQKQAYTNEESQALVIMENRSQEAMNSVYPVLHYAKNRASKHIDSSAYHSGYEEGKSSRLHSELNGR